MKTKTILSVCMLIVLLYSCTKDTPLPAPFLDCMGVEDGIAALDECGNCHQSYIYGGGEHDHSVEYISDTSELVVEVGYQLILAGSAVDIASNLDWNGGPLTAVDSCGDCHQSYVYNFVSHISTPINDTTGVILEPNEMIVIAGSASDMASNPNWNAGCTE